MTVNGYDLDPLAGLDASPYERQILAETMAELGELPPATDDGELPPGWDDEIDELANEYGLDPETALPIDLAAAYATEADELAAVGATVDLAYETERTRAAEDLVPLPRKAEDRTAHLLARIGRGTYTPGGYFRDPDDLANAGEDAPYGCGLIDAETGRCGARYHEAHCIETVRSSAATGDEEAAHAWRSALLSNTETATELASARRWQGAWEDALDAERPADVNTYQAMREILGISGPTSGPLPMRPVRGGYADELGLS